MTEFVKPSVEYFELWPLLVVFGVACLGVVVEAFLPRSVRYTAQVVLALGGLVLALVGVVLVAQDVQDALLERYGRWPLCPVCGSGDPHALEVEPELGPDPHWVCHKAGVKVAAVGALGEADPPA